MKNITFFSFILCLTFLLSTPGCEKSTDQTQVSVLGQNSQITPREDAACSDCPLDCCCCVIEMVNSTGLIWKYVACVKVTICAGHSLQTLHVQQFRDQEKIICLAFLTSQDRLFVLHQGHQ